MNGILDLLRFGVVGREFDMARELDLFASGERRLIISAGTSIATEPRYSGGGCCARPAPLSARSIAKSSNRYTILEGVISVLACQWVGAGV